MADTKHTKHNVVPMSTDTMQNKIDIEVIKNDVDHLKRQTEVHNLKSEREFASIHKKIDRIDNRLWAVAALIIASTFGKLLVDLFM